MRSLDYKLIRALDAVIKTQSFDKASEHLNITQSAISQRIKQLEQQLAQPVLVRSQPLAATALGEKLLRHYRQVRQLEYELIDQVFPEEKDMLVNIAIAVNADSLASWFLPAISPLLKQHAIELDLQVIDELYTHELLKKGEVYAALSSSEKPVTGCKVIEIGDVRYILCATPEFVNKYFSKGLNQSSLTKAPGVEFDQRITMHRDYIEQFYGVESGQYPCHLVRSSEAFVTMALESVAYCLIPHFQAQEYLDDGRLIDLAPDNHLVRTMYWHCWILERGLHKTISENIIQFGRHLLANSDN